MDDTQSNQAQILDADSRCEVTSVAPEPAESLTDIWTEVTATMRRHDDHWATLRHFARNAGRSSEVVVAEEHSARMWDESKGHVAR